MFSCFFLIIYVGTIEVEPMPQHTHLQSVATIEMESDIPYTHGDSQVADP
jgi:hypothetical protein